MSVKKFMCRFLPNLAQQVFRLCLVEGPNCRSIAVVVWEINIPFIQAPSDLVVFRGYGPYMRRRPGIYVPLLVIKCSILTQFVILINIPNVNLTILPILVFNMSKLPILVDPCRSLNRNVSIKSLILVILHFGRTEQSALCLFYPFKHPLNKGSPRPRPLFQK